jgi:hypothetical protein
MSTRVDIEFPVTWPTVRHVRQAVAAALSEYPAELRESTVMVASELVENAVKYGESVPALPTARFALDVSEEAISITVANGLTSPQIATELNLRLQELAAPGAAERLYLERMLAPLESASDIGKLGLYRIGFEGKFRLSSSYVNGVLTVQARRELQ